MGRERTVNMREILNGDIIRNEDNPITHIIVGSDEYEIEYVYNNLDNYLKEGEINC